MAKCNSAYNPKVGDYTVAGTSPDPEGEVKTEGELSDMMDAYKDIAREPVPSPENVERLLPNYAYINDDGKLFSTPPGWNSKFGLTESRKEVLRYLAAGHTKAQVTEFLDCHRSHVDNALSAFGFLLNEGDQVSSETAALLMKTFVGGPKERKGYLIDTSDRLTCSDCGEVFQDEGSLRGHRNNQYTDCGDVSGVESDSSEDEEETTMSTENTTMTEDTDAESTEKMDQYYEEDEDTLCVSEVMERDDWRDVVRVLLNSDQDGTDEKADRLMRVLSDPEGPFA